MLQQSGTQFTVRDILTIASIGTIGAGYLLDKVFAQISKRNGKKNGNGNSGELSPAEWEARIFAQTTRAVQVATIPILKQQTEILQRMDERQDKIAEGVNRLIIIQEYKDKQMARGAGKS